MNNIHKYKTKKGAASLYIVTFITLLLGIITLSFIRVMVASTQRSSNTDLSQSALDSAQAGVEDARVALLLYHDCISNPSKSGCTALVNKAKENMASSSCDTVKDILGRTQGSNEEVLIQETTDSSATNSDSMLQAYTCVKITEEIDDYRTTLDDDSRTRIIPIRVSTYKGDDGKLHSNIENINKIAVRWYSDTNKKASESYGRADGKMGTKSSTVPTISVQLFQTDSSFTLAELNVPNNALDGTDHATVFLNPLSPTDSADVSNKAVDSISSSVFTKTNTKGPNQKYFNAKCGDIASLTAVANPEFACNVNIGFPKAFNKTERNPGSVFLFVTMPYGGSATDLSIQLLDSANHIIPFVGVQALIDSTGRANDLYRRLETRLELVDIYYPYPENELELSGAGNQLTKQTEIAAQCWYTVTKSNGHVTVVPCPAVTH